MQDLLSVILWLHRNAAGIRTSNGDEWISRVTAWDQQDFHSSGNNAIAHVADWVDTYCSVRDLVTSSCYPLISFWIWIGTTTSYGTVPPGTFIATALLVRRNEPKRAGIGRICRFVEVVVNGTFGKLVAICFLSSTHARVYCSRLLLQGSAYSTITGRTGWDLLASVYGVHQHG